jgi:hypothetical protein
MVLAWFIITAQKYKHDDTLLDETKTENLTDQKNLSEDTSICCVNGPTHIDHKHKNVAKNPIFMFNYA